MEADKKKNQEKKLKGIRQRGQHISVRETREWLYGIVLLKSCISLWLIREGESTLKNHLLFGESSSN